MNTPNLHHMVAGFEHEAFGSQAVFRAALDALSHPGRPLDMPLNTALPRQGHGAAAALLLGLLDADTTLWLSAVLANSDAAAWLRFHTGCQIVTDAATAQFVWVAQGDAMPALSRLRGGSDAYPDTSATCVLEVPSLQTEAPDWLLQGPGIPTSRHLGVSGLSPDFVAQWADNQACFPRGVDVFLTTTTQIVGLPRTTRILSAVES